jgi:hypothetical protein
MSMVLASENLNYGLAPVEFGITGVQCVYVNCGLQINVCLPINYIFVW